MKFHTKTQTARLEKMAAQLACEVVAAKVHHEAAQATLAEIQDRRKAVPLSARVPIDLVRKAEAARVVADHAEYLYDKACEARNAVRSLMTGGAIEL